MEAGRNAYAETYYATAKVSQKGARFWVDGAGADFREAVFREARVREARFREAPFREARFREADSRWRGGVLRGRESRSKRGPIFGRPWS